MLSLLGSRIILNLRGMILKDHEEIVTQESMKLVVTSYKSWSPRSPPVQSTLVTLVEAPISKTSHSDL